MTTPSGPVRAGRRDPRIRQRLTQDRPEGVVTRVDEDEVAPEPVFEADVQVDDEGESAGTYGLVLEGDIVAAKSSVQSLDADGREVWHTFGVQTRVQPGEEDEDALVRAIALANEYVLVKEDDFLRRQEQRRLERRQAPITGYRG